MNNQDKVEELQRIIAIAQDDLAELMKQKGKRFKPLLDEECYVVDGSGYAEKLYNCNLTVDKKCYEHFNCYETEELATKAAVMMKRSNAIIMACLQVEPDFVPDYLSGNQEHYSFRYEAPHVGWKGGWFYERSFCVNDGPSVSTEAKWKEAAALLKKWGIE
jgi:hypothetical protein